MLGQKRLTIRKRFDVLHKKGKVLTVFTQAGTAERSTVSEAGKVFNREFGKRLMAWLSKAPLETQREVKGVLFQLADLLDGDALCKSSRLVGLDADTL